MSRIDTIEDEIKEAMRSRDEERRDALRLIVNALKNSEKELQRPLSEDEELQVLQRERKKRVEAAEAFRNGGRAEQAEAEERRDRRGGRDEHGRSRSCDGRRDAADRGSCRRLRRQPDRPREARLEPAASAVPHYEPSMTLRIRLRSTVSRCARSATARSMRSSTG
jgi:hypothetical protein